MTALKLSDLVSGKGFAPKEWQTQAPQSVFGSKPAVTASPDLRRVIALPRRPRPEPGSSREAALVELANESFFRPTAPACDCAARGRECITTLLPGQAWSLHEIALHRGLLGGLQVGSGKTILGLLAPLAMPDCQLALLLCPPRLVLQLIAEYQLLSNHWRVPSLVVHGRDWTNVVPGEPVLHVLPYSRLSNKTCTSFLETLRPDFVIADEAHKLRHADTSTTGRVLRYFAAHPEVRFCGWSGSITDKSVKDYAHLSALALREGSPLPLEPEVAKEWAGAIDPSDWPSPPGALLELCRPGEHVQGGFSRRLLETPGVVSTTSSSVNIDLTITERPAPPVPPAIQEALRNLRETWQRPDGEELVEEAIAVARCARELALGLFYRWVFPRGETVEQIEEWLAARKAWKRELREKLSDRREHLDSPLLCAMAAMRAWADHPYEGELPVWKASTWRRWARAKGTVRPETEAVRVDDYLARDAAAWARENTGVVWYGCTAFGAWVAELSGLPQHGGGPGAEERIRAERGDRSIVASIHAHGTGLDGLQRIFHRQLVTSPPSSATAWQQMLGRLHRQGQKQDCVFTEFYYHTPELREAIDEAMRRADYVEATFLETQKLKAGLARLRRNRPTGT